MGEHVIKLPDVGEGVAEAELVEWHVKVGDPVREDMVLAAVMTDKATVEIPSPVDGTVTWLGAEIGEKLAVGAPLLRLETAGGAPEAAARPVPDAKSEAAGSKAQARQAAAAMDDGRDEAPLADGMAEEGETAPPPKKAAPTLARPRSDAAVTKPAPAHRAPATTGAPRPEGEKPLASPAVRLRAKEAGLDLRQLRGSGPAGRITHEDLDAFMRAGPASGSARPGGMPAPDNSVEEIKVVGLRRRIAERMELTRQHVVPITYVEEVDVTALEELRGKLNADRPAGGGERPKLTLLPFLMRAMVKALREQPALNAHYDDEAGVIRRFGGVHVGIAAQTPGGLMVPVVRHAEARDLWDCAAEVSRLSEAARAGTATREELSGSTITITSLGAIGGIVTTPVLNHPEVAIVGVNKIAVRPLWDGRDFVPRKVMNLSSSFDHRVIDGWDASVFVQRLKALMETPALIFMEG